MASELDHKSKFNCAFIKFLTGRDGTTLRNLYSSKMINFNPNFLTFVACNDIPCIDKMDDGFSRRLRCIKFSAEFVDEVKKNNQRKIDVEINKKFTYWKNDFMLLLINYYNIFKKTKKIIPTEKILEWTNRYKETTDIYLSYLKERTMQSKNNIHSCILYEDFKSWYSTNYSKNIPNIYDFNNGINKHHKVKRVRMGDVIKVGIQNLSIIGNEGEIFDGE